MNNNNKLPRLIGICGKKRSGKDVIANYLCNIHQYTNKKISTDLKIIVKLIFGFSDSQIESNDKDIIDKYWEVTPRHIMQFIGTEVMQYQIQSILPNIGRNFWIQSFIKKNLLYDNQFVVISDLRFIHEYEELKKKKFL